MFTRLPTASAITKGLSPLRHRGLLIRSGPSTPASTLPRHAIQRPRPYHHASAVTPRASLRRVKPLHHPSPPTSYTPPQQHPSHPASYTTTTTTLQPTIHPIFEPTTGTWQYIVACPTSRSAAIIDPVLDFDPATCTITTTTADSLLSFISSHNYTITSILETHAHADHLTAASYLQSRLAQSQGFRPVIGIGRRIEVIQELFGRRYGVPPAEMDGVFDKLFDDDETFEIGELKGVAVHLPGHTPDHMGYLIGDNIFCGDSLFAPDLGTARCDFPGGSASSLFTSCKRLLSLPPTTTIYSGHDYPPSSRPNPTPSAAVKDHKTSNRHVRDGVGETKFVAMRETRDKGLGEPRLLHQSLQWNIRAGKMPGRNKEGMRLMHLPIKVGKGVESLDEDVAVREGGATAPQG